MLGQWVISSMERKIERGPCNPNAILPAEMDKLFPDSVFPFFQKDVSFKPSLKTDQSTVFRGFYLKGQVCPCNDEGGFFFCL